MGISRRQFLQTAAAGGVAVGGANLLAACGGSTSSTLPKKVGKPRHGGTLTLAMTPNSSTDTLDPSNGTTTADWARLNSIYEPLVQMKPNCQFELWLAEEITPNKNATEWTIRLRPGITFHSGKPLTADDVIWTLRRITNPKFPLEAAPLLTPIDAGGMRKLDNLTCTVPCKTPFSSFYEVLGLWLTNIYPDGWSYPKSKPDGTGPFVLKKFEAGVHSVMTRNPNYWRHPLPYLDAVVVNEFSDETSQINALLSGQAQGVNDLSSASIDVLRRAGKVVEISETGGYTPLCFRVDRAPFNDVRVRQAMKLICNREEMLKQIFDGYGIIGNDIFALYDPAYDHALPQIHQDIPHAKALLKAAGQENLTATLISSNIASGTTELCQVFAQQALAAGVHININQVTTTAYFSQYYGKVPCLVSGPWFYNPYLQQCALETLGGAPLTEDHFDNPTYDRLWAEANATLDPSKRYEIEHEMMKIDYYQGGLIVPYFTPLIDAYAPQVHGYVKSQTGLSFNAYNFKEMWLD
jgi:peptide/nickel transport system substrate-binding protein